MMRGEVGVVVERTVLIEGAWSRTLYSHLDSDCML